jgi:hypothetical protein
MLGSFTLHDLHVLPGYHKQGEFDLQAENNDSAASQASHRQRIKIDIYCSANPKFEALNLRVIAAANALQRPISITGSTEDSDNHGGGFFGPAGMFPPVRLIAEAAAHMNEPKAIGYPTNVRKSPIALGWEDHTHTHILPLLPNRERVQARCREDNPSSAPRWPGVADLGG